MNGSPPSSLDQLFPGSETRTLAGAGADIFVRLMGSGPPLLLLHGFPQTHAMWHRTAPRLAKRFSLVMPDLRGYGRSSAPEDAGGGELYSKRRMAADLIAVMDALGHSRLFVAGHDRGGRAAYRMALDHPERVSRLAVLDIVPTLDMWRGMNHAGMMATYHWAFLAQPFPLPERLIAGDPDFYADWTLASWTKAKDLSAFHPAALADYRATMRNPATRHGACNDYRAGATIDAAFDEEDFSAGKRIACPTLALWGEAGIPGKRSDPIEVWRRWCDGGVEGFGIGAGHFLPEENPDATADRLEAFFA
ncbi:MAG TPA: alpha/beta hydrolase [Mesorhizobium sp.]|jgi:haloacetate dehalogenase|nr:alpha/beta hydrolase [Mesorhizobium sp.]